MVLYDFVSPFYDPVFESIYLPFRTRAFAPLPDLGGAAVLDLACGTGQNFPLLASRMGERGKIVGLDLSAGMLRRARDRSTRAGMKNVSLLQMDAALLPPASFQAQTGFSSVDLVICAFGFTAMRRWKEAFLASWRLLKPGGAYLIHDIDAGPGNFHSLAIEMATRSTFTRKVWQPLQVRSADFRMDYIDPSAHLFGGRLFAAYGVKPFSEPPPASCTF